MMSPRNVVIPATPTILTPLVPVMAGRQICVHGFGLCSNTAATRVSFASDRAAWAGQGTVTATSGQAGVVGTNTTFLTDIAVGDVIDLETELMTVTVVTDNTHITVGGNWVATHTNVTYRVGNVATGKLFTAANATIVMPPSVIPILVLPVGSLGLVTSAANKITGWVNYSFS